MQGRKNSPLSALGISQAIEAREKIKEITFDAAYSSTSSRTVDTLKLLLDDRKLPVRQHPGLCEIDLGEWEGLLSEEVQALNREQYHNFWNAPHRYQPGRGESFLEVQQRARETIEAILAAHSNEHILMVSHGAFIKSFLTSLVGRGVEEIWHPPKAENLAYSIIEAGSEGELQVRMFCDVDWHSGI